MSSRKMRRTRAAAAAALLSLAALAAREKKPEAEPAPFYRKYLVPGDALDDRILELERRVAQNPDSAALRNDFGNLLAARRFPGDARAQYEKALELDKEHFLAAYNLGLLYETEGKTSRAIGAYRKSIGRKPGFPHSHFRLGRLYERRGWERLAVEEYAKALRIEPAMRDPRVNPLVVDTRLLDRASLKNYPHDLAAASLAESAAWAQPDRFARAPLDRSLSSDEVQDPSAPAGPPPADTAAPVRLPPSAAKPAAPAPPEAEMEPASEEETEMQAPPEETVPPPAPPASDRPPYIGGYIPPPTPTRAPQ